MSLPRHVLTILAVDDLERAVAFYREAFGWPVRIEVPVFVELALSDERGLGLYQRQAFASNTGGVVPTATPEGAISSTELYFYVDDVAAAAERLTSVGARLLAAPCEKPWGDEAAYFADPEGNVLVVAKPLHDEGDA